MTDFLDNLRIEYKEQDNRATAYPIYVSVQELISIGVMADGYSVNCPYGDGEVKTEWVHYNDRDLVFKEKNKMLEFINSMESFSFEDFEELNVGYIWHPVEFFLTIRGAEEYMKSNSHNHGKLRTYVHHFNMRNFEMRELLKTINFWGREEG